MRILLAHNLANERVMLRRLLEQDPELSVVGEVTEAEDLLIQVQATRANLVLLGWELAGLGIADVLQALHTFCQPLKVLAFGKSEKVFQAALVAGVDAYASKEEPLEWLLSSLRDVAGLSPCFVE